MNQELAFLLHGEPKEFPFDNPHYNTNIAKAKLIEYAYPTSTTATKAGYGQIGCWFVSLYKSETASDRIEVLKYFPGTAEGKKLAYEYAESLPNSYNWMHKYFKP